MDGSETEERQSPGLKRDVGAMGSRVSDSEMVGKEPHALRLSETAVLLGETFGFVLLPVQGDLLGTKSGQQAWSEKTQVRADLQKAQNV